MQSIDSLQRILHDNAFDTRIAIEVRREIFHFFRQIDHFPENQCFGVSESQYCAGVVRRLRNRLKNLKK